MSLSISLNLSDSLIFLNKTPSLHKKFRIPLFLYLIMLSNSLTTGITSTQFLMLLDLKFNSSFFDNLPFNQ